MSGKQSSPGMDVKLVPSDQQANVTWSNVQVVRTQPRFLAVRGCTMLCRDAGLPVADSLVMQALQTLYCLCTCITGDIASRQHREPLHCKPHCDSQADLKLRGCDFSLHS